MLLDSPAPFRAIVVAQSQLPPPLSDLLFTISFAHLRRDLPLRRCPNPPRCPLLLRPQEFSRLIVVLVWHGFWVVGFGRVWLVGICQCAPDFDVPLHLLCELLPSPCTSSFLCQSPVRVESAGSPQAVRLSLAKCLPPAPFPEGVLSGRSLWVFCF